MKLLDWFFPIGTRSVLFGAHCFFIHPWFVAAAWTRLYGFPTDFRLWVAFVLHDLGYLFQWCPNIDGEEGERHPQWAAKVMHFLFDRPRKEQRIEYFETVSDMLWADAELRKEGWYPLYPAGSNAVYERKVPTCYWHDLCLYHSRFYAKRDNRPPSPLCAPDKLAVALEPWWLYLPRVIASGEIREFMARAGGREGSKYNGEPEVGGIKPLYVLEKDGSLTKWKRIRLWHERMAAYLKAWAYEHRDGKQDTWTPAPATRK